MSDIAIIFVKVIQKFLTRNLPKHSFLDHVGENEAFIVY